MSSLRAPVSRILPWSCVDGPGNRFVLFLQGCNYHCLNCHNPHTIGRCNDCGQCLAACPTNALTLVDGRIRFDAALCARCDACLDACGINANPMISTRSVDDIVALIRDNRGFISGVTVSGGEATLHLPFIRELFRALKEDDELRHLTRFIDTNGHLGPGGWASVLDVTDGVMLDIKAFDNHTHRELTGKDNARSLASAQLLQAAGKLHELRFLMIPGKTDSDAEIESLAAFARTLGGPVRIRINAFRPHGVRGVAADWPAMDRARVEQAGAALVAAGLGPVVLPVIYA